MKHSNRFPYGIIAGFFAMLAFYGIAGFAASYFLLNAVAGQTDSTVGLIEYDWQLYLLIADAVFVVGFLWAIVMKIRQSKARAKEATDA